MSSICFLDLPMMPAEIHDCLVDVCDKIPLREESRLWLQDFHKQELTVAAQEYGLYANTGVPSAVQDRLRDLYQRFFDSEILDFVFGKFCSVAGTSSSVPPHCDRGRKIAINYVLRTGGSHVQTRFYHEKRSEPDLHSAENRYWKDLVVKGEIQLPAKQWHVFDVQQFHSVENIQSDRFLCSIVLKSNPDLQQFRKKYEKLISRTLDV